MARGATLTEQHAKELVLDVTPSEHGFIVRVGPMVMSLDRRGAEELMLTLAEALEVGDPLGIDLGTN